MACAGTTLSTAAAQTRHRAPFVLRLYDVYSNMYVSTASTATVLLHVNRVYVRTTTAELRLESVSLRG